MAYSHERLVCRFVFDYLLISSYLYNKERVVFFGGETTEKHHN
jgi:hypothetical protein